VPESLFFLTFLPPHISLRTSTNIPAGVGLVLIIRLLVFLPIAFPLVLETSFESLRAAVSHPRWSFFFAANSTTPVVVRNTPMCEVLSPCRGNYLAGRSLPPVSFPGGSPPSPVSRSRSLVLRFFRRPCSFVQPDRVATYCPSASSFSFFFLTSAI